MAHNIIRLSRLVRTHGRDDTVVKAFDDWILHSQGSLHCDIVDCACRNMQMPLGHDVNSARLNETDARQLVNYTAEMRNGGTLHTAFVSTRMMIQMDARPTGVRTGTEVLQGCALARKAW